MGVKSIIKQKLTKTVIRNTETVISEGSYLQGKVALILGGSGGIGGGISDAFIANGCKVIISGTNEKKMTEMCDQYGEAAKYVPINLCDVRLIKSGVAEAISKFGRIDILVHAAGTHGNEPFGIVSEKTYDTVMDLNLKSVFFSCQEVSNYMIENNIHGHILIVSSASSAKPAWTPYEISKWGVRGFTLGLADTLIQYGIVVNAIAPGPVPTVQ